jgi:flagellin
VGEQFSLIGSNNQTVQITLGADSTAAQVVADINTTAKALGITASVTSTGAVQLSSASAFTMVETAAATTSANSIFNGGTIGNVAVSAPVAGTSNTGNAQSALALIQQAVSHLGLVQGVVGAGENKLTYAINLAQSQISNFSAAQSTIRDADVAADATSLTQAQVLQQASIAALAQANSSSQALLKLFQ